MAKPMLHNRDRLSWRWGPWKCGPQASMTGREKSHITDRGPIDVSHIHVNGMPLKRKLPTAHGIGMPGCMASMSFPFGPWSDFGALAERLRGHLACKRSISLAQLTGQLHMAPC